MCDKVRTQSEEDMYPLQAQVHEGVSTWYLFLQHIQSFSYLHPDKQHKSHVIKKNVLVWCLNGITE